MKTQILKPALLTAFIFCLSLAQSMAQCPMCKIATESNMKQGGTAGNGLNFGILYMLAIPYLMVGTMAFIWKRNRRKLKAANILDENGDWKE